MHIPEYILSRIQRRLLEDVNENEIIREIRELVSRENEKRATKNFELIHLPQEV